MFGGPPRSKSKAVTTGTKMTRSFPIDRLPLPSPPTLPEPSSSVALQNPSKMPPIRSARNRKPPPAGFDDLEDTLLEFSNKMKDAENASHEGKKKYEVLWPIFQISHQRELHTYPVAEPD